MEQQQAQAQAVQAVVVADTFTRALQPVTGPAPRLPPALFPVLGVPLVNFVLETLSQKGIDETILFCPKDGAAIKDYIKSCIDNKASWTLSMDVQVMVSETCRSMGDVMRELDASGLIRGHFILMGINTISNVQLLPLFEKHKQTCKKDKGATMTLLYMKVSWGHKLICPEQAIFLAADRLTKRVLMHQKLKPGASSKTISLPLDIILSHSEIDLHHNLADTNIAFCSPLVLPLYSDNFDFQTRDDFIKGILMNEEVLSSSLYYMQLDRKEYAAAITNWSTYRTISRDILHHWVYPITYEAAFRNKNHKYIFMGNHNYKNKTATLSRSCTLGEDVTIGDNASIDDNTKITTSIIGDNCRIGKNVEIIGSHVLSDVVIGDNCRLVDSYVGERCNVGEGASLLDGTVVAPNNNIAAGAELKGEIVASEVKNEVSKGKSTSESTEWDNDSVNSGEEEGFVGYNQSCEDSASDYSSASSEDLTPPGSPVLDDTNIFLQEVIDSLARGYEERLNCDYLILEINSSRYAYNMQLHEVNFYVVRALLGMPAIAEAKNILATVKDILKFFKPILENYIKAKQSIMDCLNAVEESCVKCPWLEGRCGQVVHLLYESDVVDEDSLTEWYEDLVEQEKPVAQQSSLVKFFEWLRQASEESDDSE